MRNVGPFFVFRVFEFWLVGFLVGDRDFLSIFLFHESGWFSFSKVRSVLFLDIKMSDSEESVGSDEPQEELLEEDDEIGSDVSFL